MALTCAALSVWTATGRTAAFVRLDLRFGRSGPVPVLIRDAAIAEASRIWLRYGVVFNAVEGACTGSDLALGVVFDLEPSVEEAGATDRNDGLGTIRFAPDGRPEPSTTIHYGSVTRIATSASVMGLAASEWPTRLRDQVVARAVGRVLAHEVGHYLLRWPHHAEDGLMRPEFRASSLADPDGRGFALTEIDRARFQIVLDAGPSSLIERAESVPTDETCRPIAFEALAAIPNRP